MHAKTMEGLAGASMNMKMMNTPFRVYQEAERRGDTSVMERAMGYVGETADKAEVYPTTENFVFTHRALNQKGFTAVSGDPAVFTESLGREKNIWIVGGNTILAPVLDRNLVDYFIVQVAPVLLGAGIPLFTQKEALRRLRLEEVRKYGQFAQLVYSRL